MASDRTSSPRIVTLTPRDMGGKFIKASRLNKDNRSHNQGDLVARGILLCCALTENDATRAGLPFVADYTGQGRGFPLFDGKTGAGTLASVKRVSRQDRAKSTAAVLFTACAGSLPAFQAAVERACPVILIHAPTDEVDLDRLTFAILDARAAVANMGGWACVPDRTGAGHPGRAGSGPVWGKWVDRPNQNGVYFEVSVHVPASAWRVGTVEEAHAALDALR